MPMPISGMMVTHFSFGSFRSSQGLSCSPFLIRREWKYLGAGADWKPLEEPIADAGMEPYGDEKGFLTGAISIGSLSGVPARGVVAAVVVVVPAWLPYSISSEGAHSVKRSCIVHFTVCSRFCIKLEKETEEM